MASIKFSVTAQRMHSVLTGEARKAPMQPISREIGIVHIGNQRVLAKVWTPAEIAEADELRRTDWNANKQAQREHECGATAFGLWCAHVTAPVIA